jgi:hypothetical protein
VSKKVEKGDMIGLVSDIVTPALVVDKDGEYGVILTKSGCTVPLMTDIRTYPICRAFPQLKDVIFPPEKS